MPLSIIYSRNLTVVMPRHQESHRRQNEAAKKAVDRKQQELDDGKHQIAEREAQHRSETAQHSKQLSALRDELASLERRHMEMSATSEQQIGELEAQNRFNMQALTNSQAKVDEMEERILSLQAAPQKAEVRLTKQVAHSILASLISTDFLTWTFVVQDM